MRKRILGSLAVVAAGTGLSFGQGPAGGLTPPPGPPSIQAGAPLPPGVAPEAPGGLYLRNGQQIIPPPVVGGSLSQAEFGPPGPMPGMEGPGGPGGGPGRPGLGLWEQNGPPTFWVGFDYLMWWQKSQPMDAVLVTTGGPGSSGLLGTASTSILLGDRPIDAGMTSGLRQWFGFWTDEEKRDGLEFSWFLMESRGIGSNFTSSNQGFPLLTVPFKDTVTNTNLSYAVSTPLTRVGAIQFSTQSQAYNIEGNCVLNLFRGDEYSGNGVDFLIGMRFFDLEERLALATRTNPFGAGPFTFAGATLPAGSAPVYNTIDRYRTFNEFYGLNLGFRGDHNYGRIYWGWGAKIAVGYNNSYTDVTGASSVNNLGTTSVVPGGRFVEPSDIGRHKDGQFAILPEGNFNLGYQLTPKVRLQAGYTFMWLNRAARPGALLDQAVNGPSLPTDARYGTAPARTYNHDLTKNTDYWLQGINFGIQFGF